MAQNVTICIRTSMDNETYIICPDNPRDLFEVVYSFQQSPYVVWFTVMGCQGDERGPRDYGFGMFEKWVIEKKENKIMSEQRRVKQVIVWRKDLKVRSGKMAAQVAHAAMGPIFNMMNRIDWDDGSKIIDYAIHTDEDSPFVAYKEGRFTKVVVGIESEAELLALVERLKGTNIPHALICDAGLTEFKGVPTNTCLGIGPWWSDEIDQFTGSLPLM